MASGATLHPRVLAAPGASPTVGAEVPFASLAGVVSGVVGVGFANGGVSGAGTSTAPVSLAGFSGVAGVDGGASGPSPQYP